MAAADDHEDRPLHTRPAEQGQDHPGDAPAQKGQKLSTAVIAGSIVLLIAAIILLVIFVEFWFND